MTTVAYVGNSGSGDISVLEVASDGGVRPIAVVPVPGIGGTVESLPLALSPDGRLLFAASREAPFTVTTYAIDARRGSLSIVGTGHLPASMAYIATDRRGRYLLAAAYDGALVSSNGIEASGVVGAALDVVATAPGAHAIRADLANAHVLYTSLGGDILYQRRLDPKTGKLCEMEPGVVKLPTGAGPRHFVFSGDGRLVFVLGELDGAIYSFPYDRNAGLARSFTYRTSAIPEGFAGRPWAADLHLTPDGRFLFASERTSSSLAAFRVGGSDGRLARVGCYPTATQPRAFAIEPSGRYLLAVGEQSHTLSVHTIDARTGAATLIGEHALGRKPNWVEVVDLGAAGVAHGGRRWQSV